MIGFLRGEVAAVGTDIAVIDVGGVGYNVFMPASALCMLPPVGCETKVYTYLSVHEDAMTLFGFLNPDDLAFFKKLISVSGVGPKFALGALSTFSASDLKVAILSQDAKTISKAPGIGLKTAQKIILELKDKVSYEDVVSFNEKGDIGNKDTALSEAMQMATEALTALGYSATDSLRAVRNCKCNEDDDVEAILKQALRFM